MSRLLAGVFVGGLGTRMGGQRKGLLRTRDGTPLVERWKCVLHGLGADVVLVGRGDAYASTGLEWIEDEPSGIGPLGGLAALLRLAGTARVVAVACDMPFVGDALMRRLVAASGHPIVAPRRQGRWEPLCARYDAEQVLPVVRAHVEAGRRALQDLLDAARAVELPLSADEAHQLRDWDTPADVTAS